jgi:hypothetical protein
MQFELFLYVYSPTVTQAMNPSKLQEHPAAIRAPGQVNPSWKGVADTTYAFAEFLAELAAEAERQQRKVTRLTWVLLGVTIGLLVITGIQTLKAFCP